LGEKGEEGYVETLDVTKKYFRDTLRLETMSEDSDCLARFDG
jgi:hypothetical protein